MKNYLLVLLLLLVASKNIEYGVETAYDTTNNQFEFISSGNSFIFGYITCKTVNNLKMKTTITSGTGETSINRPGEGFLIDSNAQNVKIVITSSKTDSGVIWINPGDKDINVDLNKKYEIKYLLWNLI